MRLSSLGIKHVADSAPVDFYQTPSRQVWIVHEGHCPRQWTVDGLCTCADPESFVVLAVTHGRVGRVYRKRKLGGGR